MKLHEALNIDLNEINREIKNLVTRDKDVPKKSQLAQSILELTGSGGKRLRPLMVIVGSRFGPKPAGRRTLQLSAAAEFIHVASLIHDDIIDNAELRRGEPALHIKTGILSAVHIGNYMSARIIELLSKYTGDKDRYVLICPLSLRASYVSVNTSNWSMPSIMILHWSNIWRSPVTKPRC